MRKFVFYSTVFLLIFAAGCSGSDRDPSQAITVWHWMTDRDTAFQFLAKKYKEKFGIKVNFELYAPSEVYSERVRAAAQGQSLPDIFGILGEKYDFSSFIKAGHVLDLTPYMEQDNAAWKRVFFPKALAVNAFSSENNYGVKPGIYAVPIDVMTIQVLFNKHLFEELGLDPDRPPVTLGELLDLGPMVKTRNIQGLVSGWGELWLIHSFANNYAFNIMGKDKVIATIRGEVPYTDPDWIRVLSVFKEMRDSGLLSKALVTMVNKTAERIFASGKALFAFNGSWCVNVYKGMNPDLDYASMLPPEACDKFPMVIWGGAGSSFAVNARSQKAKEAVRFLKWLTEKEQQEYLVEVTNNLPANKDSLAGLSGINIAFARYLEDYATHPNAWDISESSMVVEAFDKGIQSIILGEKSPQQVAEETQSVKERVLSRKQKMDNKKGVISGTN